MEHYKIFKLLNDSTVSKFVTKKQIEVDDLSNSQYSVNKNVRFETSILKSYLCDYSDVYIVVKGTIDLKLLLQMKMGKLKEMLRLKTVLHLDCACQKLTVY